jgi:hypothetical protein
MNAVKSTWRQLVRRRLWPLAALLLAAMAAVPVVLAREPKAPTAPGGPAQAVTTKTDDAIAEPIVAEITPEDRARRRRVLGVRKDPFQPAPATKAKTDEPSPTPTPTSEQSPPGDGTGSGTGTGWAPSPGGGPVGGGEPAPKKRYYEPGTIIVRFGEASENADLERLAVQKFAGLPDNELPLLVYMGLTKNGKKAKFLVDAAVEVDGDGTCKPHPSSCEVIELAVGETEFLDVIDPEPEEGTEEEDTEETEEGEDEPNVVAQFQLDLVDIKRAGDADVK